MKYVTDYYLTLTKQNDRPQRLSFVPKGYLTRCSDTFPKTMNRIIARSLCVKRLSGDPGGQ